MNQKIEVILEEIRKVIKGKDSIISKVIMAILAQGHILIEDVPGVGKTTLAISLSKALDLDYKRIQFTPDIVPSDITGFSLYDKEKGEFEFKPGSIFCNLFLADEINRTSSKTQSALLEVMEEGQVTVDGVKHEIHNPFVVIATQNPSGGAGTQMLPQAQLDRFLIKISMGYPDFESQMDILRDRQMENPLDSIKKVCNQKELLEMQMEVNKVHVSEEILKYITRLVEETRKDEGISLGISPRGAIAINRMAKAFSYVEGRNYVLPEDVINVFENVSEHRIILSSKARIEEKNSKEILTEIISRVDVEDEI